MQIGHGLIHWVVSQRGRTWPVERLVSSTVTIDWPAKGDVLERVTKMAK
jgi:hypothetical protein